jgi:trafficking kinesin-binding protein 2
VVNEVYRVIVKKKKKPNMQENGKSQEAKTGLEKSDFVVYLNSGSNLLGRLRRNQSLSVVMGSFGAPVCTSSPKMGILKED